ncbi:hypothetical protein [Mycobacterium avium]|uniref:hypothetical protein n=1 Tax=Mycobacterium avium TaxID=1764 RepID=UPI000A66A877|nr:hypothetical protein [Mycobacterium avium]
MTTYTRLPRHLAQTPTPSNVAASPELSRQAAREAVRRIGRAAAALKALSETEHPSTAQMVAAVAAWTAAEREIHSAIVDVAAAAVLGGAAVSTTARGAFGVRPQTLSTWLQGTAAQLRGDDLEQADGAWKPIRRSDLHVSVDEAANPANGDARYTDTDAAGTPADASGTHASSAGAQQVSVGASAPGGTNAVDPADVEAAIRAATGEGGAR